MDIDSDEMFEVPFLFAVSVGDWELSPSQAARLGVERPDLFTGHQRGEPEACQKEA